MKYWYLLFQFKATYATWHKHTWVNDEILPTPVTNRQKWTHQLNIFIYKNTCSPVLSVPFVIKVIRFRQLPHYLVWQKQNVSHHCQPVKRAFSISMHASDANGERHLIVIVFFFFQRVRARKCLSSITFVPDIIDNYARIRREVTIATCRVERWVSFDRD